MKRIDLVVCGAALVLAAVTGVLRFHPLGTVAPFVVGGVALAVIASLIGRSVEGLGSRFGSGATGVLQAALGNLPELFVGIFALRAGLAEVVQASLVGSILANVLLILGGAFVAGGLKHGRQSFDSRRARELGVLLLLSVGVLAIPTLAFHLDTPAAPHVKALSNIVSVVLLVIFVLSIPASLKRAEGEEEHEATWPLAAALGVLIGASVLAAFVSEWFVHALEPAIHQLHVNEVFAGLVIVAVAGNAVEHVVGIELAYKGRAEYAVSVTMNSPLQIAQVAAPVLVLLSGVLGGATLTLALSPLLLTALLISGVVAAYVVVDGESTWLEGATLLGLYVVIAAAFWWG